MHNIYHTLYLNPLLEHFLGLSGLIKSRSASFPIVDLWQIWNVETISASPLNTFAMMFSFNCGSFFKFVSMLSSCPWGGGGVGGGCCIITVVVKCDYFVLISRALALLRHVLSHSHCIILMIIHKCTTPPPAAPKHPHLTHPLSLPLSTPIPSSLALKEGRTRERKERVGERNGEGKALKWLSIAASLPAVSPRRVTFAERE